MTSVFRRLAPTFNRILVRKFEQQTKTAGGIILKTEEDKANYAEVVEVGPGNYDSTGKIIPVVVKKGDVVLLPEYGSTKVKLAEGEFHLYRDSDILGVLHK
eukprot:TRINITY_DN0_c6394_g1_i1.p1 TRINITY_DN0_c6394_g1~~TRINITY_DN0_c6394_g1_i1.p1  ORF type:complete len:101 (-),score=30.43 TRINITY_DN0_c6394_g1_i1:44-346(-)